MRAVKAFTTLMCGVLVLLAAGDIVAPAVVPRVEAPSGWTWNDAWFGVMAVVGVALVAGAIMVTRHEHRGHRPIPH